MKPGAECSTVPNASSINKASGERGAIFVSFKTLNVLSYRRSTVRFARKFLIYRDIHLTRIWRVSGRMIPI